VAPFFALALGPLYLVNVALLQLQKRAYLVAPRLIFATRALLYLPLVLAVTAAFKVARASPYARETEARRARADETVSAARGSSRIVYVEGVPRARLTFWDRLDFAVVMLRIVSEFGDGVVTALWETLMGRARELDLSDENVEFLFTHSAFNNLFRESLRQDAPPAYVVDLSSFDELQSQAPFCTYGCRAAFDKTAQNSFALREIRFGGKEGDLVATPGHELWTVVRAPGTPPPGEPTTLTPRRPNSTSSWPPTTRCYSTCTPTSTSRWCSRGRRCARSATRARDACSRRTSASCPRCTRTS